MTIQSELKFPLQPASVQRLCQPKPSIILSAKVYSRLSVVMFIIQLKLFAVLSGAELEIVIRFKLCTQCSVNQVISCSRRPRVRLRHKEAAVNMSL